MIVDSLANLDFYGPLNSRFAKALAYLRGVDLKTLPEGKYEIDGDEVYMMISERDLKKKDDAAMEAHDRYIDIQVVVDGHEGFGWKYRSECTAPRGEMNTVKDIIFYDDEPSTYFALKAGEAAIFFPDDAHAPLVGDGHVKKCVIKVKC